MDKINGIEPVTEKQIKHLAEAIGVGAMMLDLWNVDLKAGRGILKGNDRCLWTKAGHRITISLASDGGVLASLSTEIDPEKPVPA